MSTSEAREDDGEPLRVRVRRVIFESTAGAPRQFDVVLIAAILLSVFVVLLDSEIGRAHV
mgnify:CR=1 FL=1